MCFQTKNWILGFFWSLFLILNVNGQDTLKLSVEEILELAIEQSIDLKIAKSEIMEQEAAFGAATFLFRPQLFLAGTIPSLNRSIEARPLPDGSDAFVNRSTMYNELGVSLDYQIEKTGGFLSLHSNIERLDVFGTNEIDYQRTYFVNPINISYTQPLFSFNNRKWEKERLSLLYLEFQERYANVREEIINQAVSLFKASYLSYQKYQLAQRQIIELDSLLVIKQRLFEIGETSRVDILRLTLEQKNYRQTVESEYLKWQQNQVELVNFIGLDREEIIVLRQPSSFDKVEIPIDVAMDLAISNQFITTTFRRASMEAEADLKMAQKDKDIEVDLRLSIGLNNSSSDLGTLWNPLLDRQIFSASIRVPLTGWEKYNLQEQVAEENVQQEQLKQEKQRMTLRREAFNLVTDFKLLKKRLIDLEEQRAITSDILQIIRRQFLLGEVSYTDLNISIRAREQVIVAYYDTLLSIIEQYYKIRKLCMYDFILGVPLSSE